MILATHAVVGGALMKLAPQYPFLGLIFSFVSHFLLDAIPHWEYNLNSYEYNEKEPLKSIIHLNKKFLFDLAKMGLEGGSGLILAFFLFSGPPAGEWIVLGAIFGVFPDFLQFLYLRIRREPFLALQRFHLWIHTKRRIKNFFGLLGQIALILFLLIIL